MPNLFKITKQGKVNYLYGTCHLDNDAVCTFSPETKQAFEQASCVAVEMTSEAQDKLKDYLISKFEEWKKQNRIGSEKPLTDYLSATQTKKIADIFEDELLTSHPSHTALFQLLETSPMNLCQKINVKQMHNLGFLGDKSLDKQIENQAKLVRKPTVSLDTPEDLAQRLVGSQFSYEQQVDYAKHFLAEQFTSNNHEEIKKLSQQIIALYLAGDPEGLTKLNNPRESTPIGKSYFQSLAYGRDPILAQTMRPLLEAGDTFFAMGAIHIPGVLSLLEKDGCVIEPVHEGERLYKVQTLKNTNITLRKTNLLSDFERSIQQEELFSFFNRSNKFTLQNEENNLQIFLDLIKEGKIDRNQKINIETNTQYNNEKLLILCAILKEHNAPKTIDLNLMDNSDYDDIVTISEIFKSECFFEELNIFFNPCRNISEQSIQCLINALKTSTYSGKLHLSMTNSEFDSPLYAELNTLIEARNTIECLQ